MHLEIEAAISRGEKVLVVCPNEKEAKAFIDRYGCDATWPGKKQIGQQR